MGRARAQWGVVASVRVRAIGRGDQILLLWCVRTN